MPVREIVTPWDRQPQELVEVDWQNPLARELAFAHVPSLGLQNLANGKPPLQVTTTYPTIEVGPSGVRYRSGTSYAEYDPNGLNSSGNSLTLMSIWRAKDSNYISGDQLRLLSCRTGSNAGWSWGRAGAVAGGGTGNLTYQTMVFQGISQYTEATPTIEAFVDTAVACRISGTTASWFARGAKSSADTTVGTASTGGNLVLFGQGPYSSPSAGWAEREYVVLAWRRPLSDAEIASLSANPWQLFQRREYVPFGSIPSGTTYNQSVSGSMTAYGAILRSINKGAFGTLNLSGIQYKDISVKRDGSMTILANPTKLTTTSTKAGSITTASNLVGADSGVEFSQAAFGSITLTSALTDAVTFVRSWSSQIALSGAIAKPVSKILSGVITLTGAVSKLITKAKFTASLTLSGIATGFGFTPGPGGGALSRGIRFMRKFIGRR